MRDLHIVILQEFNICTWNYGHNARGSPMVKGLPIYTLIPVKLPSSTSFCSSPTHARIHTLRVSAAVVKKRSATPCYYPCSPALYRGSAVVMTPMRPCWELILPGKVSEGKQDKEHTHTHDCTPTCYRSSRLGKGNYKFVCVCVCMNMLELFCVIYI